HGFAMCSFFFQAEDGIRDGHVTGVQTCALPILTAPPSFRKQNPADQPILQINLTSETLEMSAIDEFAENILAPRISQVDGVAQRSEERRVGKECRPRRGRQQYEKKVAMECAASV